MIPVKLIQKLMNDNYESKRALKSEKQFKKNNNYKSFINKLSKAFSIPKNNFILMVLTQDEDEIPINNQEDFDSYLEEAKGFMIILEDKESEIKADKRDDEREKDNKDMCISDQEIEKIMDRFKIPEIDDINDDIEFDIEKYKNDLNENFKNKFEDFKKVFGTDIKNIVSQKNNILKTNINKFLSDTQKDLTKNLESIKEANSTIKKEFDKIIKEKNEKDNTIKKLKKKLTGEERQKMIKFEKEEIKILLSIKKANYFNIDNIEICNIGNKTFTNLFFEIDTDISSKDLLFYEINSNKTLHNLSLNGPFSRGKNLNNTAAFYIKYPKIGEYTIYIYLKENKDGDILSSPLKITVKLIEDPKEKRRRQVEIQKPKEIQAKQQGEEITIKKKENEDIDYKGLNKKDVNDMLNDLENEFNISSKFNKEQAICKIIEFNCDRKKMVKWVIGDSY